MHLADAANSPRWPMKRRKGRSIVVLAKERVWFARAGYP